MKTDEFCIFCKIVDRKEPGSIVYEDDLVMAFTSLRQVRPSELMLIPKEHRLWFKQLKKD